MFDRQLLIKSFLFEVIAVLPKGTNGNFGLIKIQQVETY